MRAFVTCLAILVAGCSTSPPVEGDVRAVAADKILRHASPPPGPYTTVEITRDSGWMAGGCSMIFYVNGEAAAVLDPKERATLYVPPGPAVVGMGPKDSTFCDQKMTRERDTTFVQGVTQRYRIFIDQNGNGDVLRVSN